MVKIAEILIWFHVLVISFTPAAIAPTKKEVACAFRFDMRHWGKICAEARMFRLLSCWIELNNKRQWISTENGN